MWTIIDAYECSSGLNGKKKLDSLEHTFRALASGIAYCTVLHSQLWVWLIGVASTKATVVALVASVV